MKPAPPVMKIFLPLSTRRVYRRATVFPGMRTAFVIAVLVVAGAACGAGQGASVQTAETQLTISYWPEGRGTEEPKTWTLRCDPAGGTVPRVATVCRQLDGLVKPFRRPSRNLVCSDQYGGPQQAPFRFAVDRLEAVGDKRHIQSKDDCGEDQEPAEDLARHAGSLLLPRVVRSEGAYSAEVARPDHPDVARW